MALDPDNDLNLESQTESSRTTATEVLAPEEAKSVQEGAVELSRKRADDLKESYRRPRSKSGEIAAQALLEIFDGAKKILGYSTGERPKVTLPGEKSAAGLIELGEIEMGADIYGTPNKLVDRIGDSKEKSGAEKPAPRAGDKEEKSSGEKPADRSGEKTGDN